MGKLTIELEEHEVRELLSSLQEITEQLAEIKDLLKAANGSNTRKQSKSKGNLAATRVRGLLLLPCHRWLR